MTITSRSNPRIKLIRGLRDRKVRDRTGLFFVEGIRIVAEAVQLGVEVEELVVAPSLLTSELALRLVDARRAAGIPCVEVSSEVFQAISLKDGPQGLGAVVRQRWEALELARPSGDLGWVALDAVQDPGNLGSILRTGDAVGAAGVILIGRTTDPHDPSAVRASAGAVFSQRLVRAGPEELAAWKREHGVGVVGTSGAASTDYRAVSYPSPFLLCVGSEQHGMSRPQQDLCDLVVSIPMVGRGDSLNLAVATALVLYEAFCQRRAAGWLGHQPPGAEVTARGRRGEEPLARLEEDG
jgi:TrmH family RNA methyltransferase